MPSVIRITYYDTRNKKALGKLLQLQHAVSEYARTYEAGVTRYIVCQPADESDDTSLCIIEEYASQEWMNSHASSSPVQALGAGLSTEKLLSAAPQWFDQTPAHSFQRSGHPYATSSTHIVLTTFGYQPGSTSYSLQGWKDFVDYCEENEEPALAMTVMEDSANSIIRSVQVFENAEFVRDVHVKSGALKRNQDQNGAYRTGVKSIVKLRVVLGFLGRS